MSNVFVFSDVLREHLAALIPAGLPAEVGQWFDKVATKYISGVLQRNFSQWGGGAEPFPVDEHLYHEAAKIARQDGCVMVAPTLDYLRSAWDDFAEVASLAVADLVRRGRPVMGLSAMDAYRIGKKLRDLAVRAEANKQAWADTHHLYWHENLEVVALTSAAALVKAGYDLLNCLRVESVEHNVWRLRDAGYRSFIAVRRHGKIISLAEVMLIKYTADYIPTDADGWYVEVITHLGACNESPDRDAQLALTAWTNSLGAKFLMPTHGLNEYYVYRGAELTLSQAVDRRRSRPHLIVRACRRQPFVDKLTTPSIAYRNTLSTIPESEWYLPRGLFGGGGLVVDSLGMFSSATRPITLELRIDNYRAPDAVLEALPVAHNIGQRGRRATDELQSRFGGQKQRVVLAKAREYKYPLPVPHQLAIDVYKEHDRAFTQRHGQNFVWGGKTLSFPAAPTTLYGTSVAEAVDRVREQLIAHFGQPFARLHAEDTTYMRRFMQQWIGSIRIMRGTADLRRAPEAAHGAMPDVTIHDEVGTLPRAGWVLTETQQHVIPNPRIVGAGAIGEIRGFRIYRSAPVDPDRERFSVVEGHPDQLPPVDPAS